MGSYDTTYGDGIKKKRTGGREHLLFRAARCERCERKVRMRKCKELGGTLASEHLFCGVDQMHEINEFILHARYEILPTGCCEDQMFSVGQLLDKTLLR